jgi:hypothetical protein
MAFDDRPTKPITLFGPAVDPLKLREGLRERVGRRLSLS